MLQLFFKILVALCLFSIVFELNVIIQSHSLGTAHQRLLQNQTNPDQYCSRYFDSDSGCLPVNIGVSTLLMFLSLPIFVLVASWIMQRIWPSPKNAFMLLALILSWILLSEAAVYFRHIPIIHTNPLEGRTSIAQTIFFDFIGAPELLAIISGFTFIVGIAVLVIAT
jgi:hypothetical protein